MYAIYGNIYHQYIYIYIIPPMLAYIPAPWIPWILWVIVLGFKILIWLSNLVHSVGFFAEIWWNHQPVKILQPSFTRWGFGETASSIFLQTSQISIDSWTQERSISMFRCLLSFPNTTDCMVFCWQSMASSYMVSPLPVPSKRYVESCRPCEQCPKLIVCLVVWNMNYIFPFSWEFHHPNWRTHIFQRGINYHQPVLGDCVG